MEITATKLDLKEHSNADRIGILASILCAIHCALTPVLLIFLPTFGKAWAHPSTHWGMAIIVIPIAIIMMRKGYKKHAKKWVVAVGSLGIIFIIVGSILPYVELSSPNNSSSITALDSNSAIPAKTDSSLGIQSDASG